MTSYLWAVVLLCSKKPAQNKVYCLKVPVIGGLHKGSVMGSAFPCPLQWRHNERDVVSNHQPRDCFLNRLSRRRSKKTSKVRVTMVTGLCEGNSPMTIEFPTQMASNAENVSIWWRYHDDAVMVNSTFRPSVKIAPQTQDKLCRILCLGFD